MPVYMHTYIHVGHVTVVRFEFGEDPEFKMFGGLGHLRVEGLRFNGFF